MTTIGVLKILFLLIGLGSAYYLMLNKKGEFDIQNAGGLRIAHGFVLALLGGWFTSARPDAQIVTADYVITGLLAVAAIGAFFHSRR